MIRSSTSFTYNGISSLDFDILNVSISSGLYEEQFLPTSEIKKQRISGRDKSYTQDIASLEDLKFEITMYVDSDLSRDVLRGIARWLNTNDYKPLSFSDEPERIFYAKYTGSPQLIHNGSQGYIVVEFECNSPYSYSPDITTEEYYLTPRYLNYTDDFSTGTLEDVEIIPS